MQMSGLTVMAESSEASSSASALTVASLEVLAVGGDAA